MKVFKKKGFVSVFSLVCYLFLVFSLGVDADDRKRTQLSFFGAKEPIFYSRAHT